MPVSGEVWRGGAEERTGVDESMSFTTGVSGDVGVASVFGCFGGEPSAMIKWFCRQTPVTKQQISGQF